MSIDALDFLNFACTCVGTSMFFLFFSFSFLSHFQGLSQSNFHIMNQSNQSLLSVEETNAKNKNTNKQLNRL